MNAIIKTNRFTSQGLATARFVAQRGLLKGLVWRLTKVSVVDIANAKSVNKPFIVVANHSSHLDAPLIFGALPRKQARFLAAGAAADYFFDVKWRRALTALFFNAFPVDRGGTRTRPGLSRQLLDHGVPLLIFPEGGRTNDGHIINFKPGAAALSIATGAPVLPVALVGASEAMPRGRNWPVPGRTPVTVVFGAPMSAADGETADEFSRRMAEEIRRMHESIAPIPARKATR